ncbi:MAG: hypothetical protein K2R98_24890 [Gemmataceae bacterium]|nr:hypothetical protein [Gemmataceae bacterium]
MNRTQSEEFRQFEGEANLLVWCSWRLDGMNGPLTSSDDVPDAIVRELSKLIGSTTESVSVTPPAWDLDIRFSNGLTLRVFCDHVPGEPSLDGNWDLWRQGLAAFVGPGARYRIEVQAEPVGAIESADP